jgi:hypothetical protein
LISRSWAKFAPDSVAARGPVMPINTQGSAQDVMACTETIENSTPRRVNDGRRRLARIGAGFA